MAQKEVASRCPRGRFRLAMRNNLCPLRVVQVWVRLPRAVLESSFLELWC